MISLEMQTPVMNLMDLEHCAQEHAPAAERALAMVSLEVDAPVTNLVEHHSSQARAPAAERALVRNGFLRNVHPAQRSHREPLLRARERTPRHESHRTPLQTPVVNLTEHHCTQERAPLPERALVRYGVL